MKQPLSIYPGAVAAIVLGTVVCTAQGPATRAPAEGIYFNYAADALVDGTTGPHWGWHFLPDGVDAETATPAQLEKAFRATMDYYANTNVSCMLLNVNYCRAAFDSRVWDSYGQDDPELKHLTGWPKTNALVRQKIDHYAVCVKRCREVGLSPWASFRMNDHHYHNDPFRRSLFLQNHPDCRMGSGFNYTKDKVQSYFLSLIEEVLQRYDMDGIELDWRRTAPPAPLNDLDNAIGRLQEFMQQVRKVADAASERRGHPVFVAVRVLETPEFSRRNALDAAKWARDGLADVIIASPMFGTMATDLPMQAWREAIGQTDNPYVLVSATDHYIRAFPGARELEMTAAIDRGFTTAMLQRGADAIYLFNQWNVWGMQFTPVSPNLDRGDPRLEMVTAEHREMLQTVGRMQTSLAGPRRHIISYREGPALGPNPHQLPVTLEPGKPHSFALATGPAEKLGKVTLRIGVEGLAADAPEQLTASVNGAPCATLSDYRDEKPLATMVRPKFANNLFRVAPRIAQFDVPRAAMKDGDSQIILETKAQGGPRIVWAEMLIEP